MKPKLQLFIYQNCPYCKKVINFLKEIGQLQQVELIDASKSANQKRLQTLSGDSVCPYLIDEEKGVFMPESADIIRYLKTRLS